VFESRSIRVSALAAAGFLAACASAPKRTAVDLGAARAQLEEARVAAASVPVAQECVGRADEHLKGAESLAQAGGSAERARGEALAQLSLAETRCALDLVGLVGERGKASRPATSEREEAQAARLRRAEAEEHRLEERVSLLQRNLEMTETELIRTKARLKGTESKADASAAIAEARVLMRRALDARGRSARLNLCQEKLDRAEKLLAADNYGAAVFFAAQAQELLGGLQRGRDEAQPPRKK
jgi:cell division protein FtsB